ncbi:MAG: DNA-directed RNA polymerase subunit omega [Candidatus Sumerlaeia bacterium]
MTLHDATTMMETKREKYLLVNALARRVRALQSGSKPLVNPTGKYIDIAMEEFKQGLIKIETHEKQEGEAAAEEEE